MSPGPDNHETKREMEQKHGSKSPGGVPFSALSPAQAMQNHHMRSGKVRLSTDPPMALGPPISDQQRTIVRHQHMADNSVNVLNGDGAKKADDLREGLFPGLQNLSSSQSSSITPTTHIIQRRASVSDSQGRYVSMANINRSSSDSDVGYRFLELEDTPNSTSPDQFAAGQASASQVPASEAPAIVLTVPQQQPLPSSVEVLPSQVGIVTHYQQPGWYLQPPASAYTQTYAVNRLQFPVPITNRAVTSSMSQGLPQQFVHPQPGQPFPQYPQPLYSQRQVVAGIPYLNPFGPPMNRAMNSNDWRTRTVAIPTTSAQIPMAAQHNPNYAPSAVYTRPPFRTARSIGFRGFVPSSISKDDGIANMIYNESRLQTERNRAERNLPVVLTADQCDPEKYYASWSDGYVEVNDDLIGRCVCPADLLQFPCRWDEFRGGCHMVRLCSQIVKYTEYACPDSEFRGAEYEGFESPTCPHLHWEVEPSCRFAVVGRECEIITKKGFECSVGHDLEWGRTISRERFENHVKDAILAGAKAKVKNRTIILQSMHDRPMAWRAEALPQPYTLGANQT